MMPEVRPRTFRCTKEEHARLRELATAADMTLSRYLIVCTLGKDGEDVVPLRVGTEAEWQEVLERVRRIEAFLTPLDRTLWDGEGCSILDAVGIVARGGNPMAQGARRRPRSGGTRAAGPRTRRSLSCTDLQWECVKARADHSGMKVSRLLVMCGLGGARTPVPGELQQRLQRIENLMVGNGFEIASLAEGIKDGVGFLMAAILGRISQERREGDIPTNAGDRSGTAADTVAETVDDKTLDDDDGVDQTLIPAAAVPEPFDDETEIVDDAPAPDGTS